MVFGCGPTTSKTLFGETQAEHRSCLMFAISPTSAHSKACFRHQNIHPGVNSLFGQDGTACHWQRGCRQLTCRAEEAKTETKTDAQIAVREAQEELAQLRREALPQQPQKARKRQADSSDWISSQLTRRFGLAGGLAWLGFLTFGVVSEQIKTRLENKSEREGTKDAENVKEVTLSDGLKYKDIKLGGGAPVQQGFLTVLHYKGSANGKVFEDTKARGKPIVFLYGSRPFTAGLCLGVEKGLQGMKGGGVRRVVVPPELGFGEKGISLRGTEHVPDKEAQGSVPPNATLEYELELVRVSIPPS